MWTGCFSALLNEEIKRRRSDKDLDHRGEQQCRGCAVGAEYVCRRRRSNSLARRTGGDWRFLPHSRRNGKVGCNPARGREPRIAPAQQIMLMRSASARVYCCAFTVRTSKSLVSPNSLPLRNWLRWRAKRDIPLMEDLGSGALFDLRSVGIVGEPGVLDSLRAGVDIVTYSGDKLLGGPQAGLVSGVSELIARMRSNSLVSCTPRGQANLRRIGSDVALVCAARSRCNSCAAHDADIETRDRGTSPERWRRTAAQQPYELKLSMANLFSEVARRRHRSCRRAFWH